MRRTGAHHRQRGLVPLLQGTEVTDSGLGAAAEARVIAQRLYNVAGVNPIARIVAFDPADAGQEVPNPAGGPWAGFAAPIFPLQQLDWEDWYHYGKRHHPDLTEQLAQQLYKLVGGRHSQLGQVLGPAA